MTLRQTSLRPHEGGKFRGPVGAVVPVTDRKQILADVAQILDDRIQWTRQRGVIRGRLVDDDGNSIRLLVEKLAGSMVGCGVTVTHEDENARRTDKLYREPHREIFDVEKARRAGVLVVATYLIDGNTGNDAFDPKTIAIGDAVRSIWHAGLIDKQQKDHDARVRSERYRAEFMARTRTAAGASPARFDSPVHAPLTSAPLYAGAQYADNVHAMSAGFGVKSRPVTPSSPSTVYSPLSPTADTVKISEFLQTPAVLDNGDRVLVDPVIARAFVASFRAGHFVDVLPGLFAHYSGPVAVSSFNVANGLLQKIELQRTPGAKCEVSVVLNKHATGSPISRHEDEPCRCSFKNDASGAVVVDGVRCSPCRRRLAVG